MGRSGGGGKEYLNLGFGFETGLLGVWPSLFCILIFPFSNFGLLEDMTQMSYRKTHSLFLALEQNAKRGYWEFFPIPIFYFYYFLLEMKRARLSYFVFGNFLSLPIIYN